MENTFHDPSRDWLLSTLNTIVNNNSITIGITVFSNGFMISGHLAGGKEYFETVGNEFSALLQSGNVEDSFTGLAERIYNSDSEHIKNGPLTMDYIHIKDARFYNAEGSSFPQHSTVWWRGRLSSISGFSLGVIHRNE